VQKPPTSGCGGAQKYHGPPAQNQKQRLESRDFRRAREVFAPKVVPGGFKITEDRGTRVSGEDFFEFRLAPPGNPEVRQPPLGLPVIFGNLISRSDQHIIDVVDWRKLRIESEPEYWFCVRAAAVVDKSVFQSLLFIQRFCPQPAPILMPLMSNYSNYM
jgi:hypothetical protein